VDRDQSIAVSWDIFIDVAPVADGMPNSIIDIQTGEGDLEKSDGKLSLARIGQHGMADDDSSEVVLDYTIDFSMVNDDEGIRQRLLDLNPGLSPGDLDADYLIENYLEGINTIKGDGSVTVARANISGLYFRGLVFWDLSGNWCLGVSASMEDAGSIDGCNCQGHNDSTWERELQSVWYSRHSNCFCRRRQWPDRRVNRSSSWRRIY
jgi:hypothetical protein